MQALLRTLRFTEVLRAWMPSRLARAGWHRSCRRERTWEPKRMRTLMSELPWMPCWLMQVWGASPRKVRATGV